MNAIGSATSKLRVKMSKRVQHLETDAKLTRGLLIVAQVLALLAYIAGIQFLIKTTGGTLFVYATFGPLLVTFGILILVGVVAWHFLRSHSLFYFEEFEPGEMIFRQGEEGDCAYFIHEGKVEVISRVNGNENVVATLLPGQYFGEMALIASQPRNATVRAAARTKVAVLGKQNFLTMLSVMPSTREDIKKTVNERAMQHAAR